MNWKNRLGLILILLAKSHAEPEMDDDNTEEITENYSTTTPLPTTTTTTIPTTTKDYCHCDMEIYGTDDLEGTLKSPNFPSAHCGSGKCIYKILPHPNMTMRINVETASMSTGTTLKFWNILDVDSKEYNLFHSEYHYHERYHSHEFHSYQEFTTSKNVGFKVIFEMQRNTHSYSGFKLSFERISDDTPDHICGPSHIIVEEKETAVTIPKTFALSSGCTFLLSPSTQGTKDHMEEMYIDIETDDYTYVAVRSYDDEGLFARDAYMDSNRAKLVDASKVEVIFRRQNSAEGEYTIPKITAKLMNQSCACPAPVMNITAKLNYVTIRSPGFPDLYCPEKQCHTIINAEKLVKAKTKNLVPLMMIHTNCSLSELDNLKLSSVDSGRVIFRTSKREMTPTKFLRPLVINEQDLKVTFAASSSVQIRYFEMNITRYLVKPECVCSLFDDKEYKNSGWISVSLPSTCTVIHCHWKFSAGYSYPQKYISIEFSIDKPNTEDKVYVITDTLTEEYLSEDLTHKQSITSAASPIEFTFSRFTIDKLEDAVLNVTWKVVEACTCPDEKFYVKVNQPVVITSPNYPEQYCPNLICRHTFYAPERHYLEVRIDDAGMERYHDFLKIYDGNGTNDQLMTRITGDMWNQTYTSTSNTVFFLFMTDESNSERGYHANVFAYPFELEPSPGTFHWLLFIILTAMILSMVAGAVFFVLRKKPATYRSFQSMNNPTISYASSETGSSINITFGSDNTERTSDHSEICTELETI